MRLDRKEQRHLLQWLEAELTPALRVLDYDAIGHGNRAYAIAYKRTPFARFVADEWPCYRKTLEFVLTTIPRGACVLDVGMFVPVMPLLLTRHGYSVTTVDRPELFQSTGLKPLIDVARKHAVEFLAGDFNREGAFAHLERFDGAMILNVFEHLLGSPHPMLKNARALLHDSAPLVVSVPNQARLIRRLGLLFGISVLPDFEEYFASSYPFEGHHREYTRAEVFYALTQSGFWVERFESIRYYPKGAARCVVSVFANILPRSFHQGIWAVARKASDAR